jgi:hypothetical protein
VADDPAPGNGASPNGGADPGITAGRHHVLSPEGAAAALEARRAGEGGP